MSDEQSKLVIFRAASIPDSETVSVVVDMLLSLQASVHALAMTICDMQSDIARLKGEILTPEAAWTDYEERFVDEKLSLSFAIGERFPPIADAASK